LTQIPLVFPTLVGKTKNAQCVAVCRRSRSLQILPLSWIVAACAGHNSKETGAMATVNTEALCNLIRYRGLKPDENGNIHFTKEMLAAVQEMTDEEMIDANIQYSWERDQLHHTVVEWMRRHELVSITVNDDGTLTYVSSRL
jgi:hypothetical protein